MKSKLCNIFSISVLIAAFTILTFLSACRNNDIYGTWDFTERRLYESVNGNWQFARTMDPSSRTQIEFRADGTATIAWDDESHEEVTWRKDDDRLFYDGGPSVGFIVETSRNELRLIHEALGTRQVEVYRRAR
ncbi:MAG: hypothetical protein FWC95_06750 [Defluviitaleaceae bacterium]|nr:hypothetical protein [Defluviitaleaceae bacterium]